MMHDSNLAISPARPLLDIGRTLHLTQKHMSDRSVAHQTVARASLVAVSAALYDSSKYVLSASSMA